MVLPWYFWSSWYYHVTTMVIPWYCWSPWYYHGTTMVTMVQPWYFWPAAPVPWYYHGTTNVTMVLPCYCWLADHILWYYHGSTTVTMVLLLMYHGSTVALYHETYYVWNEKFMHTALSVHLCITEFRFQFGGNQLTVNRAYVYIDLCNHFHAFHYPFW